MKPRRFFLLILTLCLAVVALSACGESATAGTVPPGQELPTSPNDNTEKPDAVIDEIFFTINNRKIPVTLETNSAVAALVELLKEGDITYTASEYGGFEKVGALGHSLPRSDARMTTEAGDVVLYLGNQIVLFYGSNSWSYTKLGKIRGVSAEEWKEILTETDPVTVTIGLQ